MMMMMICQVEQNEKKEKKNIEEMKQNKNPMKKRGLLSLCFLYVVTGTSSTSLSNVGHKNET